MPSKGLEWAIARASNTETSGLADRDWAQAVEVTSTDKIFMQVVADCEPQWTNNDSYLLHHPFGDFAVKIVYDPDADFSYFTCDGCTCDGTLYFTTEIMRKLAYKVVTVQTYDKRLSEQLMSGKGKGIKWTVGNYVVLTEYGEKFAPEKKPWMNERVTVLLPLRMDVR